MVIGSPRSFTVKSEVVVAQPGERQDVLENGRFVRNRLVVVERGGFPIVQKVTGARNSLWQPEAI